MHLLYIQVVENGNPTERRTWFPDIEPLFKLLSYENVPPYLKVNGCVMMFLQESKNIFRFLILFKVCSSNGSV